MVSQTCARHTAAGHHSGQLLQCLRHNATGAELARGLEMANKKQPGLFPGCSADQWIQPVDDAAILFEAGKDGFASINGDAVMLGTALIDGGVQSVAADKVPLISDLLADPSIGMDLKETNKAVRLYTSNGTSKARAFYDMRSDTCVVCPTKDLASLISRTTL